MRTIGVDLSAEASNTAVAVVDWEPGAAHVAGVHLGVDDAAVLTLLSSGDRAAIDCPLGWPEPFVDFLIAHRTSHVTAPTGMTGLAWRRTLSRRATDLHVAAVTGVTPLSVAADRIAAVAMRAAGLLSALALSGSPVDRAGGGHVVEVYPAAALSRWQLPHKGYKGAGKQATLGRLVDDLLSALPGLRLGDAETICRRSDDALDSVVCALVARAAALGLVEPVPAEQSARASTEGWIALPTAPLGQLL